MERFRSAVSKIVTKSGELFGSNNCSGKDYVNVPKEEQELTKEDYEFGGEGYMLDTEKAGEDGGEDEGKDREVDKKQKTSSLQASWNIGNLIQGIINL